MKKPLFAGGASAAALMISAAANAANLAETTGVPELAAVSLPSATGNTKGVLGGGQVGCNYQFAPNWVIGIEGDGEAAGIKGDLTESVTFTDPRTGGPNTVTGTAHAQTDWIASVTG